MNERWMRRGLMGWLDDSEAAAAREGEDDYAKIRHRLIYTLSE